MGRSLVGSRRAHLGSWLGLVGLLGKPAVAFSPYGGRLDFSLPVRLDALDPADPYDLGSALLGPNVFATLYDVHPTLGVYPTLARGLPTTERGRTTVELRPGLRFASGAPLDARAVAFSLGRARKRLSFWSALPECRARGAATLEFSTTNGAALALALTESMSGIVPPDFRPDRPDASGAFQVTELSARRLVLARNGLCARGGALLDDVRISSASVEEGLRAFESRESSLALGGLGLHHDRPGARRFTLPELGLVVVRGGSGLGTFDRPGAMQAALGEVDRGKLGPLGVRSEARTFVHRSLGVTLAVEDSPLLLAIAEALGADLGAVVRPFSPAERSRHLGERATPLGLVFVRQPDRDVHRADYLARALSALDGDLSPVGSPPISPEKLARRLRLGIVGALAPTGGIDPRLRDVDLLGHLALEGASLYAGPGRI